MSHRTKYKSDHQQASRALRHSQHDGMAYSVMTGAGETYFSAFALLLHATTWHIGLLTALPPLIGSFAQLFSAWLGHIVKTRKIIIVSGALLQGLSWLPLFALPLLFPAYSIPVLILCVTVYHALGNLIIPQWSSLMGDLVRENQRGRYFARRNRITSMTNFIALVCAGLILHFFQAHGRALSGFIIIFLIAFVARLLSVYFLGKMYDPPGHVASLELPGRLEWWRRMRHSRFLHFSLFIAMMNLAVGIAAPYFTVYMLRDLELSYMQFMLLTATSILTQFLTFNSWGRLSDAFGNRFILLVSGCIVPLLPAAWILSANFWYLICVQVVAGFFWAGFSLCSANFLFDLVPPQKRISYLAAHHVFAAIGVFLGAVLGAALAYVVRGLDTGSILLPDWDYTLHYVFALSTLMRLLVFIVFIPRIREARVTRAPTAHGVVLRATRSPVLAGLVFELGGGRKPPGKAQENDRPS